MCQGSRVFHKICSNSIIGHGVQQSTQCSYGICEEPTLETHIRTWGVILEWVNEMETKLACEEVDKRKS
jgi:hypothetical protein